MKKQIFSQMAGTMWKVLVKPGDAVRAGDTVAIMESMKMEISVEAEYDGTIETINAPEGTVVDEGVPVITLC